MSARLAKFRKPPPRRFSREWYLEGLRTAVWVAIITALIWVYADIHFTKEEELQVTLLIHPPEEMIVLSPSVIAVRLKVKGRKYVIDQFGGTQLSYDPAEELQPGLHRDVSTIDIIRRLLDVRRAGLEVISAQPGRLDIHLDRLERVPGVPVVLDYPLAKVSGVKLSPERVDLLVPASRAGQIVKEGLRILARVKPTGNLPVGEPVTRQVLLVAPGPGCRLVPEAVMATFTVSEQVGKKEFVVPVRIQMPWAWTADDSWSKYKIETKPGETRTRTIVVSGSPIDLEQLSAGTIRAYIVVTEQDKRPLESWSPGEVRVQFPDPRKFRLAEPVPPVNYRLVKLAETAAAPS
jgi:hypothetical protein